MQDNERKSWQKGGSAAKAIGAYVANMLDPIARARGFAITSLLSEWPAVVGEELARFTAPGQSDMAAAERGWGGCLPAKRLADRRRHSRAQGRRPSRHRGAASRRADLGAGEHLFRLPGRRPAALPPGARAEGQEPRAQYRRPEASRSPPLPPALPIPGSPRPLDGLRPVSAARPRDLETRFRFSRFCHKELA